MYDLEDLKLESAMEKSSKWSEIAEAYLSKHKEYRSINIQHPPDINDGFTQCYNKNIYYKEFGKIYYSAKLIKDKNLKTMTEKRTALKKLAHLLDAKIDLICAVECHTRKQVENDVRTYINIIKNQFLSLNTYVEDNSEDFDACVYLNEDSPLLLLGYIHDAIYTCNRFMIFTTPDMAVITTLFMELAIAAGLEQFGALIIVDKINKNVTETASLTHSVISEFLGGATGVVTSRSDLDSAVDKFISSSPIAPWRFNRILVQESVYDHFKNLMKWKHDLGTDNKKIDSPDLTYTIDGKTFVFDFTGRDVTAVTIEAYRTTKELLKLLDEYQPYHLSLWSNDVVEAREIIHKTRSRIIWLNDHAVFKGPDAVFNLMFPAQNRNAKLYYTDQSTENWSTLNFYGRKNAILTALDGYLAADNIQDEVYDEILIVRSRIVDEQISFSTTHNNTMLEVVKLPMKCVVSFPEFSFDCLKTALYASAVAVEDIDEDLLDIFRNNNIPIMKHPKFLDNKPIAVYNKLIWSNYGTIFAN